jgi:hypothetical protein
MLRTLFTLGNEHVLRPFDLKVVRWSRAPASAEDLTTRAGSRRIVFFHTPKCGGTSVARWLAAAFGGPAGVDPLAAEAAARNLDIRGAALREALLAYLVQRKDARFISGHFSYSRRAFLGREPEFDLITILRNPLDRVLSEYYYNRFRQGPDHFRITCELAEWLGTKEASASGALFTWMFAGDIEKAAALGTAHTMRSAATDAIESLERFAIVGTLERRKDFEAAIRQRYGIKSSIEHLRKSRHPGYLRFADQPVEAQERLRELCAPDMAIYERFAQEPQALQVLDSVPRVAE